MVTIGRYIMFLDRAVFGLSGEEVVPVSRRGAQSGDCRPSHNVVWRGFPDTFESVSEGLRNCIWRPLYSPRICPRIYLHGSI